MYVRLVSGGTAFLIGVVLAFVFAIDGRWLAAAGFVAAGATWGLRFVLWDVANAWPVTLFATAVTLFSIFDVVFSSNAINLKEQDAQQEFTHMLLEVQFGPPRMSPTEKKLVSDAFTICALQTNHDQMEFVLNAQKAIYLGPALTLADGVNSVLDAKPSVRCLDYYRELRKTQPGLFVRLERHHPWLLNTSAD